MGAAIFTNIYKICIVANNLLGLNANKDALVIKF